jgi:hypothetical protein
MGHFSIDNPESLRTFNGTLASEQRWSSKFTGRAIEEYKRFMILAAISDKEVTPSEIVDQVWHKHLQYSSNYRDELCGRVLGKLIDHNPGDGRSSESRYIAQYVDTLLLYKATFGENPPGDIWPLSGAARSLFDTKTRQISDRRSNKEFVRADSDDYYLYGTPDTVSTITPKYSDDVSPASEPHGGGVGFLGAIREFFSGENSNHNDGPQWFTGLFDGLSGIFSDHDSNDDGGSNCGGGSCGGSSCGD